ncbi:MAG TPA: hypothetical protein VLA83_07495 [Candidatus Binatia bacterium]|nr:hypothetical protein [Candidatus Binatia bacterium]
MEYVLGGDFLSRLATAAFRHNGVVKTAPEAFRELVQLIIAVNFDGFLGGIHYHVAFFAPMKMLI